jgi:hypothetical protein
MTSLISARRAAEDFARVVDGSQKDVADRYADLTATVDLLRRQDTPAARPEFVADLRAQLMAAADTLLIPVDAEPTQVVPLQPRRHQRRLAAAAAAFVVVGGTAGVAAAAENSLPGDPLYALKRGIESAQVSLNTSDAAKGRDLIGQANTRLDEVDGLVSAGDSTSQISHTLASFKRSESGGADLLFVAYQRGGSSEDLANLRSTLLTQRDRLTTLAGQAPPTTQADFASAAALVSDLDQQARVLCSNCGPDTGASDFGALSSSPALQSLISDAAAAAVADQQAAITKSLADKASQIASTIPKVTTSTDQTTRDSSGSVLPGSVTVDNPPTTQTGTVNTVTGGVDSLLGTVDDSTGGALAPVTDPVSNTLDAVTNLLVGP